MTSIPVNTKKAINTGRKSKFTKIMGSQWQLMLMSIPMLLYVLLFNYAPLWGWVNAFKDYSDMTASATGNAPWFGLGNFEQLFSSNTVRVAGGRIGLWNDFGLSLRNTLAMSAINLVMGTVSSILLAVLLNEVRNKGFKRTVQTVTYLPHFLSMIVVVSMAQNIFASSGVVNSFLLSTGLIKEEIFWLGDKRYFWLLVGIINVWKEVGWNTIIYISAMTSIDPCLHEAAAIDGAGRLQRILHVTLPGIKSTFVILLIMNIGHLLEAGFEIQYLLGRGVVYEVASTIDIFVLKYGTEKLDIGLATAAGMFKSVVAIVLLIVANLIAKALDEDTLI
ncbi:MAG: sugar ABC transporter permease [Clostridia bacterium]|nr:sugar ABC transporter permease [Clostridia bacterium]